MSVEQKIIEFYKYHNIDSVKYITEYNGYSVYMGYIKNKILYTGSPLLVLVKDNQITEPTLIEIQEIYQLAKNKMIKQ